MVEMTGVIFLLSFFGVLGWIQSLVMAHKLDASNHAMKATVADMKDDKEKMLTYVLNVTAVNMDLAKRLENLGYDVSDVKVKITMD